MPNEDGICDLPPFNPNEPQTPGQIAAPIQSLLITCPACSREVSKAAVSCPNCGHPFQTITTQPTPAAKTFQGPPVNCRHCGGSLKKDKVATSEGMGCIIAILGLVTAPFIIGIPALIYGIILMSRREGIWRCKNCHEKFPRKINWWEFG